MISNLSWCYINSEYKEVRFQDPIWIKGTDLFDFEWTHKAEEVAGRRLKVRGFRRPIARRKVSIDIIDINAGAVLDQMYDAFAVDIEAETPGRLYIGESYVSCYVVESKKQEFYDELIRVDLTILIPHPVWVQEDVILLHEYNTGQNTGGWKFPMKFPARFRTSQSSMLLSNATRGPSYMLIEFFGPCDGPNIAIDSMVYGVTGKLQAGERYVIDQIDKKVTKITAHGEIENVFHLRTKASSVFTPLASGDHILTYSGKFKARLTLKRERGERQWS